jgi:hypothetical protein
MDDVQAKLFNAVLRKLSKHHLTLQYLFECVLLKLEVNDVYLKEMKGE